MRYIAIEGKGGSGKTYLANHLSEKLGAQVFHLDEYGNDYEPFVGIPKLVGEIETTESKTIIFEGVGVFDDRFNKFKAFRIFVAVPDYVRRMRAKNRDVPTSYRSADEWNRVYDIWLKAESEYFTDELRGKADLIVGESSGDFDLDEIIATFQKKA